MTPNARSKALLELEGWTVDVVESRVTRFVTRDLFGVLDLIAIRDGETLGIQATTASNVSARRRKINSSDLLPRVLAAGWKIELHGWAKRKRRWTCRRETFQPSGVK